MNIEEIKIEKGLFELGMLENIKRFEDKTGTKITNIDLEFIDRSSHIIRNNFELVKVNAKVEI